MVVLLFTSSTLAQAHALQEFGQARGRKRARAPGGQGPRGKKKRAFCQPSFIWEDHVNDLTEGEFKAAYRMNLTSFEKLLSIVEKYIEPIDEIKALNSRPNAGRVPVVIELACTLRYFAGGQVTDLRLIYKPISRNRVYRAINRVTRAIVKAPELEMAAFWDNEDMLHEFEQEFASKSKDQRMGQPTAWRGQVAAVDGVHLKARAPGKAVQNQAAYFVPRKGNAPTILVLAACRQDRRFIWFTAGATSTSHDGQVFANSQLGQTLMHEGGDNATQKLWRKYGFFISGDSAFFQNDFMLGPSASAGTYNADYDYLQSSNRMPIECAFGMLTRVWGVLWRPIGLKFGDRAQLVHAIFRLHNFRIAQNLGDFNPVQLVKFAKGKWRCCGPEKLPGHRKTSYNRNVYDAHGNLLHKLPALPARDKEHWNRYGRRDRMVKALEEAGYRKPARKSRRKRK